MKTCFMELENLSEKVEKNTTENGKGIICMEKES